MRSFRRWYVLLLAVALCMVFVTGIESAPMSSSQNEYMNEIQEMPDDVLLELIARFGQTIMRARDDLENSKRAVDFGLARGFSGIQAAKHRMGLAAANFAGGPGRKRRSLEDSNPPPN